MNLSSLEIISPFHPCLANRVRDAETSVLYEAILLCQTRIYRKTVRETLETFTPWKSLKNILEIGCGPGAFAYDLLVHGLLENKSYVGIDSERLFVDRALAKTQGSHLVFVHKNIFTFDKKAKFDAILAIAVLQHLGSIDTLLQTLRSFLKKDGYVFCFDAMPGPPAILDPQVPLVHEMFRQISAKHTLGKRNDNCLVEFQEKASQHELHVLERHPLEIPVALECNEDYVRLSFFTSELVKSFYAVHVDQEKLLQQLLAWLTQKGTATLCGWGKLIAKRKKAREALVFTANPPRVAAEKQARLDRRLQLPTKPMLRLRWTPGFLMMPPLQCA